MPMLMRYKHCLYSHCLQDTKEVQLPIYTVMPGELTAS
jgi:hypothetical protein